METKDGERPKVRRRDSSILLTQEGQCRLATNRVVIVEVLFAEKRQASAGGDIEDEPLPDTAGSKVDGPDSGAMAAALSSVELPATWAPAEAAMRSRDWPGIPR